MRAFNRGLQGLQDNENRRTETMVNFALNPHVLKNVPLFSSFSDQQLAALLPAVQHRRFPRGSFIIRAGEETDALYIILAGHAKVLIPDDDGNEVILSN